MSEEQLRLFERELARHIGPLAKVLVKRNNDGAGYSTLANRLAEQISDLGQRSLF